MSDTPIFDDMPPIQKTTPEELQATVIEQWAEIRHLRDKVKELEILQSQSHSQCHDVVCNGSRNHPRGTEGVSCSCGSRDSRNSEERNRLRGLLKRMVEEWEARPMNFVALRGVIAAIKFELTHESK